MTDYEGKQVLVAGGAGEVGEGIVRAFLERGARVIVPSRSENKLADLRARMGELAEGKLFTLVAETTTEEGMSELKLKIERHHGPPHAVVATLGGWWHGSDLHKMTLAAWNGILQSSLTSHFLFARTFIPLLIPQPLASYTLINGGAALAPVPNSGPVSIMAQAQIMLKDVLAYENKGRVRVNTLLLATPVATRSRTHADPSWITTDEAGAYCAYIASRQCTLHGETIHFKSRDQLEELDV